ncbi:hypothetical protein RFI_12417, partial [Reticulomyxa filosa]
MKTNKKIGVEYYGYCVINEKNNPVLNGHYILMEYMPESLISFIKKQQSKNQMLKEKHLWFLFLHIARGIAHIHNLTPPLAHRDMKVENVLITHTRVVSKEHISVDSNHDNLSKTEMQMLLKICDFGMYFNTPSPSPPPKKKKRKPLSVKVDIWALGVIFFIMAFLQHPFPDGNKMQILDAKYSIPDSHPYSKK